MWIELLWEYDLIIHVCGMDERSRNTNRGVLLNYRNFILESLCQIRIRQNFRSKLYGVSVIFTTVTG